MKEREKEDEYVKAFMFGRVCVGILCIKRCPQELVNKAIINMVLLVHSKSCQQYLKVEM